MARHPTLRAPHIDYGAGVFLVTFCVAHHKCVLGDVTRRTFRSSPIGLVLEATWGQLPDMHPGLVVHESQVLPNHCHAVLELPGSGSTLGTVIGVVKSRSTRLARAQGLWNADALWHRGYHDRRIRSDAEFEAACRYVRENPARWVKPRSGGVVR